MLAKMTMILMHDGRSKRPGPQIDAGMPSMLMAVRLLRS